MRRTTSIIIISLLLITLCNSAHVKTKKKQQNDSLLTDQNASNSNKQQEQHNPEVKQEFEHFSDYLNQSSNAQKDFIIQFMEINELQQYQARFFIMSLLAVFTVALCCFGVKYILNFAKTCKTATSEIKWMKEVENQQEIASQNIFTEY